jgi:trehalose 6-phosphate phosphatase
MSRPLGRGPAARRAFQALVRAERPLLFLDLDGTLAPLGEDADRARVPAATRRTLVALRRGGAEVVLVSGRSARAVARISGTPVDAIIGDHGARLLEGGRLQPWLPADHPLLPRAARAVEEFLRGRRGIWLERKDRSLAIHLRLPGGHANRTVRQVAALLRRLGLRVLHGNRVLDAQLPGVHKGAAVRRWLRRGKKAVVLYAGDDTTDRDAFLALAPGAVTIAIGRRVPGAAFRTRNPATFATWLRRLAEARAGRNYLRKIPRPK